MFVYEYYNHVQEVEKIMFRVEVATDSEGRAKTNVKALRLTKSINNRLHTIVKEVAADVSFSGIETIVKNASCLPDELWRLEI